MIFTTKDIPKLSVGTKFQMYDNIHQYTKIKPFYKNVSLCTGKVEFVLMATSNDIKGHFRTLLDFPEEKKFFLL